MSCWPATLVVGRGRAVRTGVAATVGTGVGVGDAVGEGVGVGVAGAIVAVGEGLGKATSVEGRVMSRAAAPMTTTAVATAATVVR
jgi:hypothetical protein